jgi:hypothetical protein
VLNNPELRKLQKAMETVPSGRMGEEGRTSMPSPTAILSALAECASVVSGVAGDVELQDTYFIHL